MGIEIDQQMVELDHAVEALTRRLKVDLAAESRRQVGELAARLAQAESELQRVKNRPLASAAMPFAPKVGEPSQAIATTPSVATIDTASRQRAPSSQGSQSLGLPQPLSLKSLDAYLRKRGFQVMDNRSNGGGGRYWIVDDGSKFRPVLQALREKGVQCQFYARRRHCSEPSFWVDTGSVLPG